MRARGFTLIEMLVVLAVAALIVSLVMPRLTGAQERAALRTAAHELAAGLRSTRSRAMTRSHSEVFVLDTRTGAFRAGTRAGVERIPGGIGVALTTVAQDQDGGSQGGITFFADGSSTGGGIALTSGKDRNTVLVDWLTGRVSIAEASGAPER
jgi:general secretion pathway protein H